MRGALLGLLFCAALCAQVTPTTASNDAHGSNSCCSIAKAYPSSNTAGNFLWASAVNDNTTGSYSSVVDTYGSWTKAAVCAGSGYGEVEIWYTANAHGGANTVTFTQAAGSGSSYVAIHEWTNIKLTSPLDVIGACNVSASSPFVSLSGTTTGANDLVAGVIGTNSGAAISGGTGFTAGTGQVSNIQATDEWGVFAPGSHSANFTSGGGSNAPTLMVSFLPLVPYDFSIGGATTGYAKAASGNISVTKTSGNWTSCTVSVSDGLSGAQQGVWGGSMSGTGTGSYVANGISTFNATYTPAIAGTITFTWSSSCGSAPPLATTYTSNPWTVSLTGCTSGNLFATSGTCTVTLTGGTFNGAITMTEADYSSNVLGNGSTFVSAAGTTVSFFSVTPVSGSTATFTINPVVVGTINLTTTFNVPYITAPAPTGYAVTSADVGSFTAAASGNWNSAATWTVNSGSHTTPHSGDSVTITGYHVTCSGVCYVGTNPGNNTTYALIIANNGSTASGELEIAANAVLWLTGNYKLNSNAGASPTTFGILKVDTGGHFVHDVSNGSVAYRGVPGASANWNIMQFGTLGDVCDFVDLLCFTTYTGVNNGAVNPVLLDSNATTDSVTYQEYGTLYQNCGSSSKGCMEVASANVSNGYAGAGVFDFESDLFWNTGTVQGGPSQSFNANSHLTIFNNRSVYGTDLNGWFGAQGAGVAGAPVTCVVKNNYFDAEFDARSDGWPGCQFQFDAPAGGFAMSTNCTQPWGQYDHMILVANSTLSQSVTPCLNITNSIQYMNWPSQSGSAHFGWDFGASSAKIVSNIADTNMTSPQESHCGGSGYVTFTSSYTSIWLSNLAVMSPAGMPACQWQNYAQPSFSGQLAGFSFLDHNGGVGMSPTQSWLASVGHPTAYYPQNTPYQSMRSNGYYSPTACNTAGCTNYLLGDLALAANTPPAANMIQTGEVDYNNTFNATTTPNTLYNSSSAVAFCKPSPFTGTAYQFCNATAGAGPGTHELHVNPNYINTGANLAAWAVTRGQANSFNGAMKAFSLCQDIGWCIADAERFIHLGYQPTNVALWGAAHDGPITGVVTSGSGTGTCTVSNGGVPVNQDAYDLGFGALIGCSFSGGSVQFTVLNPGQYYRVANPAQISWTGSITGSGTVSVIVSPGDIGPVTMAVLDNAGDPQ